MKNLWPLIIDKMTNGIYVLTACYSGKINGMIVSWVSQASYDPPLIVAAIHPNRYCHNLVKQSGCFVLHILSRNQTDLIGRFNGPDPSDKFKTISWEKSKTGCPILNKCIACMECDVIESYCPGNHTLFIGEVRNGHVFSDDKPLSTLDYSGTYLGKN